MTFTFMFIAKKLYFLSFHKIFIHKKDEYFNHFTFINFRIDFDVYFFSFITSLPAKRKAPVP